jgi:hypothetical protein
MIKDYLKPLPDPAGQGARAGAVHQRRGPKSQPPPFDSCPESHPTGPGPPGPRPFFAASLGKISGGTKFFL